jgi:hypothetical protein
MTTSTDLAHENLLLKMRLAVAEAVALAVVEIDEEGYVESMQNVPSWQRLDNALRKFQEIDGASASQQKVMTLEMEDIWWGLDG